MILKIFLPMKEVNDVLVKFQIPELTNISLSNLSATIASILIQSVETDPLQTFVYPRVKQYLQLLLGGDTSAFPWFIIDQQLTASIQKVGLGLAGMVQNGKIVRHYSASSNPNHCGFITMEIKLEK